MAAAAAAATTATDKKQKGELASLLKMATTSADSKQSKQPEPTKRRKHNDGSAAVESSSVEKAKQLGEQLTKADDAFINTLTDDALAELGVELRECAERVKQCRSQRSRMAHVRRIIWLDAVKTLRIDGVPDGELERNVLGLLNSIQFVSERDYEFEPDTDDPYELIVYGHRCVTKVGPLRIAGECSVSKIDGKYAHCDEFTMRYSDGNSIEYMRTLSEARVALGVPNLPLYLLGEILMASVEMYNEHTGIRDDYGCKCNHDSWSGAIQKELYDGVTDYCGTVVYKDDDTVSRVKDNEVDYRCQGWEWMVLKSKAVRHA